MMDKVLRITTLKEAGTDFEYWIQKSYAERLEAIEFLRQQYIQFKHANQGFQRVCRIIRKA